MLLSLSRTSLLLLTIFASSQKSVYCYVVSHKKINKKIISFFSFFILFAGVFWKQSRILKKSKLNCLNYKLLSIHSANMTHEQIVAKHTEKYKINIYSSRSRDVDIDLFLKFNVELVDLIIFHDDSWFVVAFRTVRVRLTWPYYWCNLNIILNVNMLYFNIFNLFINIKI